MKYLLATLTSLLFSASLAFAVPVAVDDSATVSEGGTVTMVAQAGTSVLADSVLDNDTGVGNVTVSLVSGSGPSHQDSGVAFMLNGNGTFSYKHDDSENFTDSFDYLVTDNADGSTATATVTIDISPLNDNTPVAMDDATSLSEGGSVSVLNSGATSVLDNDTDDDTDAVLTVTVLTDVSNGDLTLNSDGTFTYDHDGEESTTDSFTYILSDGVNTTTGTVDIAIAQVNDPPVANDDSATVLEGDEVSVLDNGATSLLDNDTDPDRNSADTLTIVLPPSANTLEATTTNGTISIKADGTFTYRHDDSETVEDSYVYTMTDGTEFRSATLTITIIPESDQPPTVVGESATVAEGGTVSVVDDGVTSLLANDSTGEFGELLTVLTIGVIPTEHGSVEILPNGEFTYTNTGVNPLDDVTSDFFDYTVSDNAGGIAGARVNIAITPKNDAPVAVDDDVTVLEGGTVSNVVEDSATSVLDNDLDEEDDDLTVTNPGTFDTTWGTVTLEADGEFTYTHDGSETTTDSFDYEITDGEFTSTATVNIAITPVNEAPVANDDHMTVTEGGSATNLDDGSTSVLANDTDQDKNPVNTLTVDVNPLSGPSHGTLVFDSSGDGTFTYTHNGDENATDSFVYEISDDDGLTATATVLIWVTGDNDNDPVANDDIVTATVGGTVSEPNLLANDTDADLDAVLTVTTTPVSDVSHGTLALGADGSFTYTHDGGTDTTDTFTYEISDGDTTATATVSIGIFDPINISTQPMDVSITTGSSSTELTVDADGSGLTYNWFRGESGDTSDPVFDEFAVPIRSLGDNIVDDLATSTFFNGNDALVLSKDGVIIDVIGVIGVDPGSEWGSGDTTTKEHTLVRKSDVTSGNPDGFVGNETDLTGEWIGFPQNTFENLGMHTFTTATATDLFFSEYAEGSSNNKAYEIYNGTGAAVDLTDYKVEIFGNGSSTPTDGRTLNLIDIMDELADGATLVIVNDNAAFGPDDDFDTGPLTEDTSFWVRIGNGDITVDSDTATVTVLDVFAGVDIDGFPDYKASPWYGNYFVGFFPWIYHDEAGWQFVDDSSLEEAIFVWDLGLGFWVFLNEDSWRYMYVFSQSPFFPEGWYFSFAENTPELRFFQDVDDNIRSIPPGQ